MNEETFNMSIRRFLKNVGVRSQAEIERCLKKYNLPALGRSAVRRERRWEGADKREHGEADVPKPIIVMAIRRRRC